MNDIEARTLELLKNGRKPNASDAARKIAEDYPYTLAQVQRAYESCQYNGDLTRAYLDLAVTLDRNDPCEPNPRPDRAPVVPIASKRAPRAEQIGFFAEAKAS